MKIPSTRLSLGQRGEQIVCDNMLNRGYRILERNLRYKFGEIDIVAEKNHTLCFVEVRTRENADLGHPLETISVNKQKRIRRAAEAFISRRHINNYAIRFDVAFILWSTMEYGYVENAF